MRNLEIAALSCGLLASFPAFADSSNGDAPPPQMKLGGADPRGPGPLTVPPADIPLPPPAQSTGDDFTFDYHGYFRAPLILSTGQRANPTADQNKTTFHIPAAVPDATLGSWLYNNNLGPGWANILFSYGNKTVTGTVGLAAYNFTASQDSGQTSNNSQVSLGPVYLHFNLPKLLGAKSRVDWDVGAFGNRYGTSGKYDYGAYGMFLFGATGAIGETLGAEFDIDPITLRLEHGVGGNYYISNEYGSTLLHHAHLAVGYQQYAKFGVHYLTSWTTDDRDPAVAQGFGHDGRLTVMGADARVNAGILGELYFGFAQAKASHAAFVGPVIYTVNALGGRGMRDNFFGPGNDGTGTVNTVLVQYDYSFVTLARYLAHYPKSYWADGPELKLSLFGTMSKVSTDSARYDNVTKSKLGAELMYTPLTFLSVGARFDRVNPDSTDTDQSFSVLSPKIVLHTNFFSHDAVTIQYSHYSYGAKYPRMASCGSFKNPQTGDGKMGTGCTDDEYAGTPGYAKLPAGTINDRYSVPLNTSGNGATAPYDKDVIYVSASMWW